jgi:hypothetical protein
MILPMPPMNSSSSSAISSSPKALMISVDWTRSTNSTGHLSLLSCYLRPGAEESADEAFVGDSRALFPNGYVRAPATHPQGRVPHLEQNRASTSFIAPQVGTHPRKSGPAIGALAREVLVGG